MQAQEATPKKPGWKTNMRRENLSRDIWLCTTEQVDSAAYTQTINLGKNKKGIVVELLQ